MEHGVAMYIILNCKKQQQLARSGNDFGIEYENSTWAAARRRRRQNKITKH